MRRAWVLYRVFRCHPCNGDTLCAHPHIAPLPPHPRTCAARWRRHTSALMQRGSGRRVPATRGCRCGTPAQGDPQDSLVRRTPTSATCWTSTLSLPLGHPSTPGLNRVMKRLSHPRAVEGMRRRQGRVRRVEAHPPAQAARPAPRVITERRRRTGGDTRVPMPMTRCCSLGPPCSWEACPGARSDAPSAGQWGSR